jgi:hypothetical protein
MRRDFAITGLLSLMLLLVFGLAAGEARAQSVRYLAFDAKDRTTQALTRGVTLEVERGLFGAVAVRNLFSTSSRGSASFRSGGPDAVRSALPDGARETRLYEILQEGDGRGLVRALCPGSDQAWLVVGRVRVARPLTLQAVGLWPDGQYRHCVQLNYDYRGEWAMPAGGQGLSDGSLPTGPR